MYPEFTKNVCKTNTVKKGTDCSKQKYTPKEILKEQDFSGAFGIRTGFRFVKNQLGILET